MGYNHVIPELIQKHQRQEKIFQFKVRVILELLL